MALKTIRTLVLSSGGGCGFVHAGFLEALETDERLLEVDTIVGCSIGVVVGLCWILGMTPTEIEATLFHLNDESVVSLRGLASFLHHYGIDDGEYLSAFFVDILLAKGMDPHLTLRGLYDLTAKRLLAVTFNLSSNELDAFGPETHPDLPVVHALRASTAIPIGFAPFRHNDDLYVDGAIRCPYPMAVALSDALARHVDVQDVFGSNIVCTVSGKIDSLGSYLQRLAYVCTTSPESNSAPDTRTVIHTIGTPTTLEFAQSRQDAEKMRRAAVERTSKVLENSEDPKHAVRAKN